MKQGFTKSYRKELESDIWKMPPLYQRVFFLLRLKVKYKVELFPTTKRFGIWLRPGQWCTSYNHIAKGVSWFEYGVERIPNRKTIKVIIDWLIFNEMISIESNRLGTYINITNWHVYHSRDDEEVTFDGQPTGQSSKHLLDTIKELKRIIKELKKKKPKTLKTFSSDSEEYRLANYLFQKILENKPDFKKPNIQAWIEVIDLMCRIDKRSPEVIAQVIAWCQNDNIPDDNGFCWSQNILSASKLRKQFDQLEIRMGQSYKKPEGKRTDDERRSILLGDQAAGVSAQGRQRDQR